MLSCPRVSRKQTTRGEHRDSQEYPIAHFISPDSDLLATIEKTPSRARNIDGSLRSSTRITYRNSSLDPDQSSLHAAGSKRSNSRFLSPPMPNVQLSATLADVTDADDANGQPATIVGARMRARQQHYWKKHLNIPRHLGSEARCPIFGVSNDPARSIESHFPYGALNWTYAGRDSICNILISHPFTTVRYEHKLARFVPPPNGVLHEAFTLFKLGNDVHDPFCSDDYHLSAKQR
jgi:hypothetical protein